VLLTTDLDENFVDEPGIAKPTFTSFQCLAISRSEFQTPSANGFVRDDHFPLGQHILNISEAHTKAMVRPHRVTDNLRRESVSGIA